MPESVATQGDRTGFEDEVRALAESVKGHPALNNDFYKLWTSTRLPGGHVEIFARNYYERVKHTPDRIALAFLHMTDMEARAETVENLYDEMGHGNAKGVHVNLLRRFFEALLSRLYGRPVDFAHLQAQILPSTRALITDAEGLFGSPHPSLACGALLAQEWHAYTQLVYVYEGARNYMDLFGEEEFHELCEYFYIHIGWAEKEHRIHSLSTAATMCRNEEDLAHLKHGFDRYLSLLAANWEEIYRKIDGLSAET
jgi:pyrroloquinoline quinone (PQQ) biosynthesis protein C